MIGFVVAFVFWLAAIVSLAVSAAGFLESTGLLLLSAVLSALAIVASVGTVVRSRRG